jgi:hypothetical protein
MGSFYGGRGLGDGLSVGAVKLDGRGAGFFIGAVEIAIGELVGVATGAGKVTDGRRYWTVFTVTRLPEAADGVAR